MFFFRKPLWKADRTVVRDAGDVTSESSVPDRAVRLVLGLGAFPFAVRYILDADKSDLVVLALSLRSLGGARA